MRHIILTKEVTYDMPCGLWLNAYTPKCYLVKDEILISHGKQCLRDYGKLTMKSWSAYVDNYNASHGLNNRSHIGDIRSHGIPKSVTSRFGSFSYFKSLCGEESMKKSSSDQLDDDLKKKELLFEQEWKKQFNLKKK